MSLNSQYIPSFLEEFRTMKLDMLIRDLHKLSPEELLRIKQEVEKILYSQSK